MTGAASLTDFTGSGLGVGAFVDFDENYDELLGITVTTTASGTNYDYAFDAVYQMGQAIKEANGENERDLYVIFMSDGSPNYYNYYGGYTNYYDYEETTSTIETEIPPYAPLVFYIFIEPTEATE